jgi:hypothetical protein
MQLDSNAILKTLSVIDDTFWYDPVYDLTETSLILAREAPVLRTLFFDSQSMPSNAFVAVKTCLRAQYV